MSRTAHAIETARDEGVSMVQPMMFPERHYFRPNGGNA